MTRHVDQLIDIGHGMVETIDKRAAAFRAAMSAVVDRVDGAASGNQQLCDPQIARAVLAKPVGDDDRRARRLRVGLGLPGLPVQVQAALTVIWPSRCEMPCVMSLFLFVAVQDFGACAVFARGPPPAGPAPPRPEACPAAEFPPDPRAGR